MRTGSASTVIAKLSSAATWHGGASCSSFDPKFTFRALFKLSPSYKFLKLLIFLTEGTRDSVLSTGHSIMILTSALQTIMFFTCRTTIIIQVLVKLKQRRTPSSRAPRCILIIHFNILVQWELVVLFQYVALNILLDISGCNSLVAILHWTVHVDVVR